MSERKRDTMDDLFFIVLCVLVFITNCRTEKHEARLDALESRAAWFRPEAVKETTDDK